MKKNISRTKLVIILITWLSVFVAMSSSFGVTCNVVNWGAVPDDGLDDSAAFQACINYLGSNQHGVLYIPAGAYHINTRITRTQSWWDILILGDGIGSTKIYSQNAAGIFKFTHTQRYSRISIREITLVCDRVGAGTAIEATFTPGGNKHNRSLVVEDVEMIPETQGNYFNCGINATGMWRPLFVNVTFKGVATANVTDSSAAFIPTAGFLVNGAYAPCFDNCIAWSAYVGFKMYEVSGTPEDGGLINCDITRCRYGIYFDTIDAEPQLLIKACSITARDYGVFLDHRKFFQIRECTFSNLTTLSSYTYRDIHLGTCYGGVIADNIFVTPHNATRKCVELQSTDTTVIANNDFNMSESSAVVQDAECDGNLVNDNYN